MNLIYTFYHKKLGSSFFFSFSLILLTILLVDRFYKHICLVASWISETQDQWRNSSLRDLSSKMSKSYVEKKTHMELESYLRTKSILLLLSKPLFGTVSSLLQIYFLLNLFFLSKYVTLPFFFVLYTLQNSSLRNSTSTWIKIHISLYQYLELET